MMQHPEHDKAFMIGHRLEHTVRGLGFIELRDDAVANMQAQTQFTEPATFTLINPHRFVEPYVGNIPKCGPTGKPQRNKAKTRAAKQARRRNR